MALPGNSVSVRVHDSPAGAEDRLRKNLVGDAETRTELLLVVVDRRAAVTGVGAAAGKLENAGGSTGIGHVGIEEREYVIGFPVTRKVVVAEPKIQRQLAGDLPIVLNVWRYRTEARAGL